MKPIVRWVKFNLVGAFGMVVQLSALAFFNRIAPGHYLYATVVAIEVTLLHNFIWHLRLTWRDRRDRSMWLAQLLRFQLSNGVISLLGNLLMMRALVQKERVPLLLANAIAIVCCSILNFLMGDRWAFAEQGKEGNSRV